ISAELQCIVPCRTLSVELAEYELAELRRFITIIIELHRRHEHACLCHLRDETLDVERRKPRQMRTEGTRDQILQGFPGVSTTEKPRKQDNRGWRNRQMLL